LVGGQNGTRICVTEGRRLAFHRVFQTCHQSFKVQLNALLFEIVADVHADGVAEAVCLCLEWNGLLRHRHSGAKAKKNHQCYYLLHVS
jgi:hypothetical protein